MPTFKPNWKHVTAFLSATAALVLPVLTQLAAGKPIDMGLLVPAIVIYVSAISGIFTASAVPSVNETAVLKDAADTLTKGPTP
jgi:hypothetical protein